MDIEPDGGSARAPARAARRQRGRPRARGPPAGGGEPLAARSASRRRAVRARACSGRPARGGSRAISSSSTRSCPCSLEPAGEALVQLCARRLRQRRRRRRPGSADGGSGRRRRPASCGVSGRTSSLRTSDDEPLRQLAPRPERAPARRLGGRPAPRRNRARARSARSRRAGRAARRAAPGSSAARRPRRRPTRCTSASISSTKSGLPSAASTDPFARSSPSEAPRRRRAARSVCVGGERLEQHGRRVQLAAAPARPPVEQLGPRHAEQQDRRVARQVGDVLDQVEERRLPPVEVVEHDRRAAARVPAPRAACGTPRRSPRPSVACSLSPSSDRIAADVAGSSRAARRAA